MENSYVVNYEQRHICTLLLILFGINAICEHGLAIQNWDGDIWYGRHNNPSQLQYRRDKLIAIGESALSLNLDLDLPSECVLRQIHEDCGQSSRNKRKRGKRGGVRRRVRARKSKPPLPTILLSNVRSIKNKLSELYACARYLYEYRDSCLLCFTET